MGFSSALQGRAAHDALLVRQDAELRLLETMKRCLMLKVKCDKEYALQLTTVSQQGLKIDRADDLQGSVITKAWRTLMDEWDHTAKQLKSNAESLESVCKDKLTHLHQDKQKARKAYQEEHTRIAAQFHNLNDDVLRKKAEYQKNLDYYKTLRSRFEEHYVKSGRGGRKLDDVRDKYQKACRKLHLAHNEYVLLISEAIEVEKDFRTILLPGLLEHQQSLQEGFISIWRNILQEASHHCDFTADKFKEIQRRVETNIQNINPAEEYREFTEKHKTSPAAPILFQFDQSLIEDSLGNKLQPNALTVDNLTVDWLRSRLNDLEVSIKECVEKQTKLITEGNGIIKPASPILNGGGFNGIGKDTVKHAKDLNQLRCQERQMLKSAEMIKTALNEVGCEELPSGCDDLSVEQSFIENNGGSPDQPENGSYLMQKGVEVIEMIKAPFKRKSVPSTINGNGSTTSGGGGGGGGAGVTSQQSQSPKNNGTPISLRGCSVTRSISLGSSVNSVDLRNSDSNNIYAEIDVNRMLLLCDNNPNKLTITNIDECEELVEKCSDSNISFDDVNVTLTNKRPRSVEIISKTNKNGSKNNLLEFDGGGSGRGVDIVGGGGGGGVGGVGAGVNGSRHSFIVNDDGDAGSISISDGTGCDRENDNLICIEDKDIWSSVNNHLDNIDKINKSLDKRMLNAKLLFKSPVGGGAVGGNGSGGGVNDISDSKNVKSSTTLLTTPTATTTSTSATAMGTMIEHRASFREIIKNTFSREGIERERLINDEESTPIKIEENGKLEFFNNTDNENEISKDRTPLTKMIPSTSSSSETKNQIKMEKSKKKKNRSFRSNKSVNALFTSFKDFKNSKRKIDEEIFEQIDGGSSGGVGGNGGGSGINEIKNDGKLSSTEPQQQQQLCDEEDVKLIAGSDGGVVDGNSRECDNKLSITPTSTPSKSNESAKLKLLRKSSVTKKPSKLKKLKLKLKMQSASMVLRKKPIICRHCLKRIPRPGETVPINGNDNGCSSTDGGVGGGGGGSGCDGVSVNSIVNDDKDDSGSSHVNNQCNDESPSSKLTAVVSATNNHDFCVCRSRTSTVDGLFNDHTYSELDGMTLATNRPLYEEEWFHGVLPREEVVRLLKNEGDFLVRETIRNDESQIVLSVCWNGHKHFIVQTTAEGHFRFEGPAFPSIQELIVHQHMSETPVTCRSGAVLKKPVLRERWELSNDDVILQDKIGRGNFGDVYKARLKSSKKQVAVKTCRMTLPDEQKRKFLQEGRILKQYDHPNIVKLIGICVQKQPIMIVMELVPGGSLLNFLRKNTTTLNSKQMMCMCRDAAAGMRYLESKNCIHRDLAARNCLIGFENIVKISDFGMSREEEEYIVSDGMKQIPIKWTAPEALNFGKYTSLCDVWSYGILMWEIFSKGDTPYAGMSNSRARESIDSGYRMPAPENTPAEMYRLMLKCWTYDAENRPHFEDIYTVVDTLISRE